MLYTNLPLTFVTSLLECWLFESVYTNVPPCNVNPLSVASTAPLFVTVISHSIMSPGALITATSPDKTVVFVPLNCVFT